MGAGGGVDPADQAFGQGDIEANRVRLRLRRSGRLDQREGDDIKIGEVLPAVREAGRGNDHAFIGHDLQMPRQGFDRAGQGLFDRDLTRLEPRLRRLHDRLAGVVIENLDWMDVIARYDRPGTLFYLDPPYLGGESDYGVGVFIRGDFQRMADKLRAIEGRFLLSINDRPEIRELFAWADMEAVQTTYSIAGGDKASTAAELLIGKGVELAPAAAQASLF